MRLSGNGITFSSFLNFAEKKPSFWAKFLKWRWQGLTRRDHSAQPRRVAAGLLRLHARAVSVNEIKATHVLRQNAVKAVLYVDD
mmetsp:Transcript_54818/g.90876  ORF Transcript_54818/g.90876 Transcript_54818/m.90876 type:complete len:84 (+) Transcript_54818:33-284(+)